jgi:hypothetical protein
VEPFVFDAPLPFVTPFTVVEAVLCLLLVDVDVDLPLGFVSFCGVSSLVGTLFVPWAVFGFDPSLVSVFDSLAAESSVCPGVLFVGFADMS